MSNFATLLLILVWFKKADYWYSIYANFYIVPYDKFKI